MTDQFCSGRWTLHSHNCKHQWSVIPGEHRTLLMYIAIRMISTGRDLVLSCKAMVNAIGRQADLLCMHWIYLLVWQFGDWKAKTMMLFQSALLSLLHYEFSFTFPHLACIIINCCLLFIILKGRRGIGPAHLLPTTLFVTTCRHTIHLLHCI